MLTPELEKKILCGKASYNTAVIGGAYKNILNVRKDHFIIITDICYFSMVNTPNINNDLTLAELQTLESKQNTQLKIFSAKTSNNFIFRNNFVLTEKGNNRFHVAPQGITQLNTYLVHESAVSFTFSIAGNLAPAASIGFLAVNDSEIGFPPPIDLGIKGQRNAIPNNNVTKPSLAAFTTDIYHSAGGELYNTIGLATTNDLMFPVDQNFLIPGLESALCYPLINISYVEISGNLSNIQS